MTIRLTYGKKFFFRWYDNPDFPADQSLRRMRKIEKKKYKNIRLALNEVGRTIKFDVFLQNVLNFIDPHLWLLTLSTRN